MDRPNKTDLFHGVDDVVRHLIMFFDVIFQRNQALLDEALKAGLEQGEGF
jgi:hypothetical protein